MEIRFQAELFALVMGVALAIGWALLLLSASIWQRVWRWVDDDDGPKKPNYFIAKVMTWLGFTRDRASSCFPWQRKGGGCSDDISAGDCAIWYPLLALLVAPLVVALCIRFYPIALAAGTLYLLARLARFARRHKKLFDKHIKDPEAHK